MGDKPEAAEYCKDQGEYRKIPALTKRDDGPVKRRLQIVFLDKAELLLYNEQQAMKQSKYSDDLKVCIQMIRRMKKDRQLAAIVSG